MSAVRSQILLLYASISGAPLERCHWDGLNAEERFRAAAISDPAGRKRFVLGRHLLRTGFALLCAGAPVPPLSVQEGKPAFLGNFSLDFSISHSSNAVAVALSSGGRVGIDIERYIPLDPGTVSVVFSEAELATFGRLAPRDAGHACLAGWVAKEASAKLLGCPKDLDVRQLPAAAGEQCRIRNWTLDLDSETYFACLAYEGEPDIILKKESA